MNLILPSPPPMTHRRAPCCGLVVACVWLMTMLTQAAEIEIHGLSKIFSTFILEKIEPQLEFIRTREATDWRASDAAFLVRRQLLRDGYRDVKVAWSLPNAGQTIRLDVSTGSRYRLTHLDILGVPPKRAKELAKLFKLPGIERASRLGKAPPFLDSDEARGLELLITDHQSRGYWSADVVVAEKDIDSDGAVEITLNVNPGPEYRIANPEFLGHTGIEVSALEAITRSHVGKVANTINLNQLRLDVENAYAKEGYQFAEIRYSPILGNQTIQPQFSIESHQRYTTGDIAVTGLVRTRPERVEPILKQLEGQAFNALALSQAEKRLIQTQAFSDLRRIMNPREDGTLDVEWAITEARHPRGMSLHAGAGSFEGIMLGVGYYDRNFLGGLYNLAGRVNLSNRGALGEARLTDPFFLSSSFQAMGRLHGQLRLYEGYTKQEYGATGTIEKGFTKNTKSALAVFGTLNGVAADGLPEASLGPTDYLDFGLKLRHAWDTRDVPLNPRKGYYFGLEASIGEILSEAESADIPYWSLVMDAALYFPLGESGALALRGQTLQIGTADDAADFPIDKRFFLGGPYSVRSFAERAMGPTLNSNPTGGTSGWAATAEYTHAIVGPVRAVVFADAGQLTGTTGMAADAEDLECAAGLGLRIDLPIGPVRLEYGHNLTRGGDEPSGSFHFALGFEF